MPDIVELPEFARSLRAAGDTRSPATCTASDVVYLPLLEARARAHGRSRDAVLGALNGASIAKRIESLVTAAVTKGVVSPAYVRARTAEAHEALSRMNASLADLDACAAGARDDDAGWQRWIDALHAVFAAADSACRAVSALLENPSVAGKTRWFNLGAR